MADSAANAAILGDRDASGDQRRPGKPE